MKENLLPGKVAQLPGSDEQASLLEEIEVAFAQAKDAVLGMRVRYGERLRKTMATVTVKLAVLYDAKTGYDAVTHVSVKVPEALPVVTSLRQREVEGSGGIVDLFIVPPIYDTNPGQRRLCAPDGTGIDQETGQPSPTATIKIGQSKAVDAHPVVAVG